MNPTTTLTQQATPQDEIMETVSGIITATISVIKPWTVKTENDFYTNRDLGDEDPGDLFEA